MQVLTGERMLRERESVWAPSLKIHTLLDIKLSRVLLWLILPSSVQVWEVVFGGKPAFIRSYLKLLPFVQLFSEHIQLFSNVNSQNFVGNINDVRETILVL